MRSSNKMSGALGKMAIVIILALVLAFLVSVAPISAVPKKCSDFCDPKVKVKTAEWPEHLETKICKTSRGTKWLIKDRVCTAGDYIKQCQKREYCPNTKVCAKVGNKFPVVVSHWKSCTAWKKHYETIP